MHVMRSILCAGLAMIAMSLCASMPAAAAVPIDVHVVVQPMTGTDYPAFPAVAIVHQDVAVLPSQAPTAQPASSSRSSAGNVSPSIAGAKIDNPAYLHIDPGRMRV
jgi:hypothetical protein